MNGDNMQSSSSLSAYISNTLLPTKAKQTWATWGAAPVELCETHFEVVLKVVGWQCGVKGSI